MFNLLLHAWCIKFSQDISQSIIRAIQNEMKSIVITSAKWLATTFKTTSIAVTGITCHHHQQVIVTHSHSCVCGSPAKILPEKFKKETLMDDQLTVRTTKITFFKNMHIYGNNQVTLHNILCSSYVRHYIALQLHSSPLPVHRYVAITTYSVVCMQL